MHQLFYRDAACFHDDKSTIPGSPKYSAYRFESMKFLRNPETVRSKANGEL